MANVFSDKGIIQYIHIKTAKKIHTFLENAIRTNRDDNTTKKIVFFAIIHMKINRENAMGRSHSDGENVYNRKKQHTIYTRFVLPPSSPQPHTRPPIPAEQNNNKYLPCHVFVIILVPLAVFHK